MTIIHIYILYFSLQLNSVCSNKLNKQKTDKGLDSHLETLNDTLASRFTGPWLS